MTISEAFMFMDYANEKPDKPQGVKSVADMTAAELKAKREELREQYGEIG